MEQTDNDRCIKQTTCCGYVYGRLLTSRENVRWNKTDNDRLIRPNKKSWSCFQIESRDQTTPLSDHAKASANALPRMNI
jgi:hypothetical protein